MKATSLAKFFGRLSRLMIGFDVDFIDGYSFRVLFGVQGIEDDLKRKGTFVSVYVRDNSLAQDYFIDATKNLNHPDIYVYPNPYKEDENELMYIIRITDEEDEW